MKGTLICKFGKMELKKEDIQDSSVHRSELRKKMYHHCRFFKIQAPTKKKDVEFIFVPRETTEKTEKLF